jgi:hypothetical protein
VGPHAECNTYVHHTSRGGFLEVSGGIGACLAASCRFNDHLECRAPDVKVASNDKHADCTTFEKKSRPEDSNGKGKYPGCDWAGKPSAGLNPSHFSSRCTDELGRQETRSVCYPE